MVKPCYIWPKPSLYLLFSRDSLRIFMMENLVHNWELFEYFRPDDYIFVQIGYLMEEWNFKHDRECWNLKNKVMPIRNIIFLCNTIEQVELAKKYGFSGVLCNHNCWLDERVFDIKSSVKEFDLIINCRSERNFKRPYLSGMVENKAIIRGNCYNSEDYFDLESLNPKYINQKRIPMEEVAVLLGRSYVGGIFSEKEGACYTSSEYLLCGVPVVSTYSKGGRDVWYNDFNSILVAPDERAVLSAVVELKRRVMLEPGLPLRIRNAHLQLMAVFRSNFLKEMDLIFWSYNIGESAEDTLQRIYLNQYKKFVSLEEAIQLLRGE